MKKYLKSIIIFFIVINFTLIFQSFSQVSGFNQLFNLENIQTAKFEEFQLGSPDTYTVIYFLNYACPCTLSHIEHLNNLSKEFNSYKFLGFHANKNTSTKLIKKNLNKYNLNFNIYNDKNLLISNKLLALKTPHIFILNKEGNIVYQGAVTDNKNYNTASVFYLKETLNQIQQNKTLTYTETKTTGCYIQR